MYAHRRVYVKQWEHDKPEERYTVQIACGGKPVSGIQSDRISTVEEEVMSWRKANHIHAWFVDNVQNGQDDCKPHYVPVEALRELLDICEEVEKASKLVDGTVLHSYSYKRNMTREEHRLPGKVIKDATVAKQLLPTRSGFFFGNTEYDEGYLNDVVETREWLYRMLADEEAGVPGEIYYSASW